MSQLGNKSKPLKSSFPWVLSLTQIPPEKAAMSTRSRRTPKNIDYFANLSEGVQRGMFRLVKDNSDAVAEMVSRGRRMFGAMVFMAYRVVQDALGRNLTERKRAKRLNASIS